MYALWKKMHVYFDTSTLNESVKYIFHFWLTHGDWCFLRTEMALSSWMSSHKRWKNCWYWVMVTTVCSSSNQRGVCISVKMFKVCSVPISIQVNWELCIQCQLYAKCGTKAERERESGQSLELAIQLGSQDTYTRNMNDNLWGVYVSHQIMWK